MIHGLAAAKASISEVIFESNAATASDTKKARTIPAPGSIAYPKPASEPIRISRQLAREARRASVSRLRKINPATARSITCEFTFREYVNATVPRAKLVDKATAAPSALPTMREIAKTLQTAAA